jgi:hypothetical protein
MLVESADSVWGQPMMAAKKSNPVLQVVARLVDDQRLRTLSDAELLGRFLEQEDETAFHGLVGRHGPMVLDVCRHVHDGTRDDLPSFFGSEVRKAFWIFNLYGGASASIDSRGERPPEPHSGGKPSENRKSKPFHGLQITHFPYFTRRIA